MPPDKPPKALHRRGNPFSGQPVSGLTSKGKSYYQVKTENTSQLEIAAFPDGLAREPENRTKNIERGHEVVEIGNVNRL